MTQQNSTVNPFSNHWKVAAKSFQSLENPFRKFPIIGKSPKKVSNGWKAGYRNILALLCALGFLLSGPISTWAVDTLYIRGINGSWAAVGLNKEDSIPNSPWRINIQATGNYEPPTYKFTRDGGDDYTFQWGRNNDSGGIALASKVEIYANIGEFTPSDIENPTLLNTRWYQFNVANPSENANTHMSVQETTDEPVTIASVTDNHNFIQDGAVTVTITTSAEPGSGENIYVRYKTDSWDTATFKQASGSGTSWTVDIPDMEDGTAVEYYVLTSTFALESLNNTDADLQTIKYGNNDGDNYSYNQPPTIIAQITFEGYNSNTGLDGQYANTDTGFADQWTAQDTTIITNQTLVYQRGNVRIYGGTNAAYITDGGVVSGIRSLSSTINISADITRYCGYIFRCGGDIYSTDRRYIALDDTTSGSGTSSSIAAGLSNEGDPGANQFMSRIASSTAYGGGTISFDSVYYLVLKFQSDASNWTNVTLYVNPTNTILEQAESIVISDAAVFDRNLAHLIIYENMGTAADRNFYIDEITIGETWGDVVYSNDHPTAVVLSSFTAATEHDQVVVRWQTASEDDTAGFMLYRENELGNRVQINDGFIPAEGHDGMGASYVLVDTTAEKDTTYSYVLVEYELDGTQDEHAFVRNTSELIITAPIRPVAGGIELRWLSREDEAYTILRAESLPGAFQSIAEGILATPPENTYLDETAGNQAYYRIGIDQD